MKVLFLDHDGVICLKKQWGNRFDQSKPKKSHYDVTFDDFDEDAIIALNQIITETDCEIVTSSDWRFYVSLKEMGDMFIERGIKKRPIAFTPSLRGSIHLEKVRALEIKQFLDESDNITKWVAVDDMDMKSFLGSDHFVRSFDMKRGISHIDTMNAIIKRLN